MTEPMLEEMPDPKEILSALTLHSFESCIKSYLANEGNDEQQDRMLRLIHEYSKKLIDGDFQPAPESEDEAFERSLIEFEKLYEPLYPSVPERVSFTKGWNARARLSAGGK